jgi:hypothetical protein
MGIRLLNTNFFKLGAAFVLLMGSFIVNSTGAIAWVTQKFTAAFVLKDDSRYAAAIADQLLDSAACTPFKSTIIVAGKGAPYAAATKKQNHHRL